MAGDAMDGLVERISGLAFSLSHQISKTPEWLRKAVTFERHSVSSHHPASSSQQNDKLSQIGIVQSSQNGSNGHMNSLASSGDTRSRISRVESSGFASASEQLYGPTVQGFPIQTHEGFPIQTHEAHRPFQLGTTCHPSSSEASWQDFYRIDWMPKEVFVKFRQLVEGYQLAANFEMKYVGDQNDGIITGMSILGYQVKGCNTKIVLKPIGPDGRWKLLCEPRKMDIRLLTRKIPFGPLLNFQFGLGHDFSNHTTGWKWKVTSKFAENGIPHIRHKTMLPICPGFDVRVGWNAEYVFPDLHGSMGTGEPFIGLNIGQLHASIERVEAIFTHET